MQADYLCITDVEHFHILVTGRHSSDHQGAEILSLIRFIVYDVLSAMATVTKLYYNWTVSLLNLLKVAIMVIQRCDPSHHPQFSNYSLARPRLQISFRAGHAQVFQARS